MKLNPSVNTASRQKRVLWFGGVMGGLAIVLYGVLHFMGDSHASTPAAAGVTPVNFVELKDSQFSNDDAASAMQAQQNEISTLKGTVTNLQTTQASTANNATSQEQQQMNELQSELANMQASKNTQVSNEVAPPPPVSNFTLSYLSPPVSDLPSTANYVPSNTWAKAVMIQGADANAAVTGQANSTPVIFQIIANGTGPNHSVYQLKGCRVSGAAYGDISSERAEIQLTSLSCVRPDGSILDIPVKGEVADISGKEGIRGIPVMRNGQILFNAGISGFMSGIGQSLQQSMQTQSVSPLGSTSTVSSGQTLQYGLAGGGSTALNQLASYYIQRADQYHPIIEVNAGSLVDIVFLQGFSLDSKIQSALVPSASGSSPYAPATYNLNTPASPSASPSQLTDIQDAQSLMQQINQKTNQQQVNNAQFGQTIGVSNS